MTVKAGPADTPSLGGQAAIVFAGRLFTLFVGWPFQIFVARTLGAAALGVYGLIDAGITVASAFVDVGTEQTVLRYIPTYLERGEFDNIRYLLRASFLILLITGSAAYLLLFPISTWIVSVWPTLGEVRLELLVMALLLPLGQILHLLSQSLRGMQDVRYLVLGTSILQLCVKVIVSISFFAVGLGLLGYILATILAVSFGIAWTGIRVWRSVKALPRSNAGAPVDIDWRRYAAINFGATILLGLQGNANRFLLGLFAGEAAVGVFMTVRQLQLMPVMFNQMLLVAGAPMVSAAHARADDRARQHLYTVMTDWVTRAGFPLVCFFILFAHPVLALYGQRFALDGTLALQILAIAQLVNLASGPIGVLALMSGLEKRFLPLSVVLACIETGLLVILVPRFGVVGAALAGAAYTIAINVSCVFMAHRNLGLRWWDHRYWKWLASGLGAAATGTAVLLSGIEMGVAALIGTLLLMYGVFFGIGYVQGFHADDWEFWYHLRSRFFRA